MKKFLLLLLALLLCAPFAFAEEAVYDFEDGNAGPFAQSGTCSVAVSDAFAHTGSKALAVTARSGNNWDAADLYKDQAGFAVGDQVTISAWVYVDSDEEGTFVIAKSAADYGWLANATVPGKTWTQLTATFTLQDDVNIRFQNYGDNWNSVNYYIDDVTVSASTPAPVEATGEMTATSFDFEEGLPANFTLSGSAQPTTSSAQAHAGAASLYVTGRSGNNWDAVDLLADSLGIGLNVPAKITCWVYVDSDEEGTFAISKSGGDYGTLGKATFPGKTWTEVTAEFNLDQPVNIRFQNQSENWNLAEYYIDDMVVEVGQVQALPESNEPPIDYASDFSEGLDGWYPRSGNADAALTVTDELGILMTGRTGTWNSPGRDFPLVAGKTYNMTVMVKQDQVDSTGFILSIAHTRDDAESYENLGNCTAKKGEWTMIQCTYVAGRYDKYVLYIEGGAADTEFQIKDFKCWEQVNTFGKAGIPSLKEVYADQFDFGTAVVGSEVLDEERMDFYKSQFAIFTPGNEMKPESLLDMGETRKQVRQTKDQTAVCVKFDSCIPLLDWAKANNVKVHGHVLVWHQQTPKAFFYEDYATHKPLASREVVLARMESYIKQVLTWTNENYPGVIVSWDVVNEAVADGANEAVEGNEMRLRNSLWAQVVGDDFVNRAFEYARKYAAEGTLLFYNDYNTDMSYKQLGIRRLVESLIEDGTIDGYGFQSHYTVDYPAIEKVQIAWTNMATYNLKDGSPLLLRVSELDVGIKANTEEELARQAKYYDKLFNLIYTKHADRLIAVQVWGTVDDLSWRADTFPLLFDAKTQPKPAFDAITD